MLLSIIFSSAYKNQQVNGDINISANTNSQLHPWSSSGQVNPIPPAYFVPGTDSTMPYNGKYYVAPNMTRQNNPCGNQYQQYQYPQVPYFPYSQPAAVQQ